MEFKAFNQIVADMADAGVSEVAVQVGSISGAECLWEISGDAKIENKVGSYMIRVEQDPLKDDIRPPKASRIYSGLISLLLQEGHKFNSSA